MRRARGGYQRIQAAIFPEIKVPCETEAVEILTPATALNGSIADDG
jgi:hypothetical protein